MKDFNNAGVDRLLQRGISEIISENGVKELLNKGRPLRLKMGFDPSRPDIHLGHVVGLRKLRQFQDLGHQVVLIVGDWTAQIGDPSGASATRPMLTHKKVQENARTYMDQFFRVVDKDKTETLWQSEWFSEFGLANVIELTSKFSVAQFLAREDFANRYKQGRPIAITEFLYPLLQAYDSVVTKADVEFGGTDQKFNLLVGRDLQGMMGQMPQQLILVPIIPGTDGIKKMSKSFDNYISLDDSAREMFGKIMSIPDSLIATYFELLTDMPLAELSQLKEQLIRQSVNPMILKKQLGRDIVDQFHGMEAAHEADKNFESTVQLGQVPSDISILAKFVKKSSTEEAGFFVHQSSQTDTFVETVDLEGYSGEQMAYYIDRCTQYAIKEGINVDEVFLVDLPLLLVGIGMISSKSEVRRLITQSGVDLSGEKISDIIIPASPEKVLKIGKRGFLKFVL